MGCHTPYRDLSRPRLAGQENKFTRQDSASWARTARVRRRNNLFCMTLGESAVSKERDEHVRRVLLFEWAANHFISLDDWLPPIPKQFTPHQGLSSEDFHSLSIRIMALRKFVLGKGKSKSIRLDEVWKSLQYLIPHQPCTAQLLDNLAHLHADWGHVLDQATYYITPSSLSGERAQAWPPGLDHPQQQDWPRGEQWFEFVAYGLLLHADEDKAAMMRHWEPWGVHNALWSIYQTSKFKGGNPKKLVLETYSCIQTARERDFFVPALPPPHHTLWGD